MFRPSVTGLMNESFIARFVFYLNLRSNPILVIQENKVSCSNAFENRVGVIIRHLFLQLKGDEINNKFLIQTS